MTTLDEIILKLQNIRAELGSDCPVFVNGWNDTGIVEPEEPRVTHVIKTKYDTDGEVIRAWEESSNGGFAVVIS